MNKIKRHEWRSIEEYGWPKRGEEVEFLVCKSPMVIIPACMADDDVTAGADKVLSIADDCPILWRYLDLPQKEIE